jgi:hypothetical protein
MAMDQNRGPGARKVELERRLDANAELERRVLQQDESAGQQAQQGQPGQPTRQQGALPAGAQQGTQQGHKGQQAQPHRSGRPSGGNVRGGDTEANLDDEGQ